MQLRGVSLRGRGDGAAHGGDAGTSLAQVWGQPRARVGTAPCRCGGERKRVGSLRWGAGAGAGRAASCEDGGGG